MRKIYFSIVCAVLLLLAAPVNAQVHFSLGINLGSQPGWGPVGYDEAQCYYLPDIEAYYYVPSQRFYYYQGGRWVSSRNLPRRYRDYDLYSSYKVVVNERQPWRHHDTYRDRYASFRGRHDQQPIRDSHDSKYFVNRNHPEHNNWMRQQRHDNGNHNGQRMGNHDGRGNQGDKGNNGNHGNKGNNGNRGNNGKDDGKDKGNGKHK